MADQAARQPRTALRPQELASAWQAEFLVQVSPALVRMRAGFLLMVSSVRRYPETADMALSNRFTPQRTYTLSNRQNTTCY